mmetsp:Transcript_3308/g.8229  ORF Transcript_3308/g.8229 Transcript_3308/m.8229 type:complete len:208 (+) Transcript_3308:269-892(+)
MDVLSDRRRQGANRCLHSWLHRPGFHGRAYRPNPPRAARQRGRELRAPWRHIHWALAGRRHWVSCRRMAAGMCARLPRALHRSCHGRIPGLSPDPHCGLSTDYCALCIRHGYWTGGDLVPRQYTLHVGQRGEPRASPQLTQRRLWCWGILRATHRVRNARGWWRGDWGVCFRGCAFDGDGSQLPSSGGSEAAHGTTTARHCSGGAVD